MKFKRRDIAIFVGIATTLSVGVCYHSLVTKTKSGMVYKIYGGPEHGIYNDIVGEIQEHYNQRSAANDAPILFRFECLPSEGSDENLLHLTGARKKDGSKHLGIIQSDVLYKYNEKANDSMFASRDDKIEVILPLHKELVTLVAMRSISKLKSLANRRVGIGPKGSGTRQNAEAVLDLAKIDCERVSFRTIEEAFELFRNDEIDAFFQTIGHPNKIFLKESRNNDRRPFHVLALTADDLGPDATKIFRYLTPLLSFPQGWYDNVIGPDVKTYGVTAYLCCQKGSILEAPIYEFLKSFYSSYDWHVRSPSALNSISPTALHKEWKASLITNAETLSPMSVPWHPGALHFAAEANWWEGYLSRKSPQEH